MRRGWVPATVCAGVVATAGCGEDRQFIDDYNEATKPLQTLRQDLGGAEPGGKGGGDASDELVRLADETKKVNDDLADLDAPDDAKADFEDLKAALRKSERDLRGVASATEADDISKVAAAREALARDSQAIDKAQSAVKRKVED
jgi:hypothetical protein